MWYFSYGTDLSDDLLAEWGRANGCRAPKLVGRVPAVLAHHRLCFSVYDELWGGGVADIVPQPGKTVSGVLVDIRPRSAGLLDRLAGRAVDRWGRECGLRRRQPVEVSPLRGGGSAVAAYTFVLQRSADRWVPPAARYQRQVAAAASRVGLSQFWVMQLLAFPSAAATRAAPRQVATCLTSAGNSCGRAA